MTALLCTLPAMAACTTDYEETASPLPVIEGWIEDGEFPVVKLTRSLPISTEYQSLDSLERYVMRWQRVTISDGQQVVTLTGKPDHRYMPPYIYTTTAMRGQAGRTYTLTLHGEGGQPDIQATTTIPQPASVDSFSLEKVSGKDSLYQVFAHVSIPRQPLTYYKVSAVDSPKEEDFLSSFLGVLRSDMIDNGKVAVHRGRTNLKKDFTPYFTAGNTIVVRFARIDSAAYAYWRDFEDMLSLSRIPLFPSTQSMPSQFGNAYGYWQGMGSRYYLVDILPKEEEQ